MVVQIKREKHRSWLPFLLQQAGRWHRSGCAIAVCFIFPCIFFLPIRSAKHTNLSAAVKIEESKKRNKLHVWKGKIYFIEMGDREWFLLFCTIGNISSASKEKSNKTQTPFWPSGVWVVLPGGFAMEWFFFERCRLSIFLCVCIICWALANCLFPWVASLAGSTE